MAVLSPPRPPRAAPAGRQPSASRKSPAGSSGQLHVHWHRVAIFGVVVLLTIVLVVVLVVRALSAVGRQAEAPAVAAPPTGQASPAVTSAPPSVAPRPCPAAATKPIYAAPTVAGGDPTAVTVALTFDDGPSEFTQQVLDILREKQVRATFFVLGGQVAQRPEALKAIAAAGHMIGNHTWSHHMPKPSVGWTASTLTGEMDRTERLIVEATGQRACLFRPPGGVVKGARSVSRDAGLSIAMWSVDTRDWSGQRANDPRFADLIRKRAVRGLKEDHPLVLMHDGGGYRGWTVAALPGIIDAYRSAGYQFVDLAGRV